MKTMAMFCACALMACGGSSEEAREPVAPVAPAPEAEAMGENTATEPSAPSDTATAPMPETEPAAPPEPMAPTPKSAKAELKSIPGDETIGTLTFEQQGSQIVISGNLAGLKKGDKAIYVHEKGDCGNKGKNAGGHFNPTKAKHGPPASAERHAGDFGNVTVDEAGNGVFSMSTDSITLDDEGSETTVVGRAVVVHAKKDDKKGNAGPAIACGVITAE